MQTSLKGLAEKKGIPYFVLKLSIFLLLLILADFAIGKTLAHFYAKQKSGWEHDTQYAIDECKADIIVLGSSRAQHSYVSEILEKQFGQSCYNAGRDGQSILYHYPVFHALLKRYTPKMVIMDCEDDMFSINTYSYERISCLLPYYRTHEFLQPYIGLRSSLEPYKLWSQIYPYNSMLLKIAASNIKEGTPETEGVKGYRALPNALDEPIRTVDYTGKSYALDEVKIKLYKQLIADCKSRNIKLYIVCSPYYSKFIGEESSVKGCREIALQNQIPYFDFRQDSFFMRNSKFFDDTAHVNDGAAQIFTKELCKKITKQ
ncbi:MAG: hypothetical protein RLY16_1606 [Bacteroidota bacterium]